MKNLGKISNPYNDDKVIDACSIFGMMDTTGRRFSGKDIMKAIGNMHVRGNGLGGGFAVYGLYPDYADHYAFHVMYLSDAARETAEIFFACNFEIVHKEEIPTKPVRAIIHPPAVWRYFVDIKPEFKTPGQHDDDYVVDRVMKINTEIADAFVFSSGKNMGVFKGVGYPEEIGEYFLLENYEGYLWTSHGRFPTNTPGWWGGAHPFCILDWTVVHNGEISSYGINKRYLEQFGYNCTMQTDTEVVAYAVDLLVRKHGFSIDTLAGIFSAPFWADIERMAENQQQLHRILRQVYSGLLLNGPFTIIIAHQGEMIGLTDRIRLRPLTAAIKDTMLFLSSEESAIRLISPDLDKVWIPTGGEPVIGRLKSPTESHSKKTATARR